MTTAQSEQSRPRGSYALFLAATFVWSWAWWGHLWLTGQVVAPGSAASHLPGLAGPLVGAALVALVEGGTRGLGRFAMRLVRLPGNPALAALLLLAPVAMALAVLWFGGRTNGAAFFAYPGLNPAWSPAAIVLAVVLLNGLGEEAGWRGHLFDRLAVGPGPFKAALLVVVPWALWHAPLFVVHAGMAEMVGPILLGWLAGLVAASFVLGWLYRWSGGSVLFVGLWHTAFNFASATPPMNGAPAAAASTMVMLAAAVIAWAWWRSPALRPPA
jgi:membrane protease YdiL (CAAX protease family)